MTLNEKFPLGARVIFNPQNSEERYIAQKGWSGTVTGRLSPSIRVRWDEASEYTCLVYSPSDLLLVNPAPQSPEDFL